MFLKNKMKKVKEFIMNLIKIIQTTELLEIQHYSVHYTNQSKPINNRI